MTPKPPPTTADAFERRWRQDPDPWRYATSVYEGDKYASTLEACGPPPIGRALELAGANGVFTARLAGRASQVESLDASPTAVGLARERLAHLGHVTVLLGPIPDALPTNTRYDVIVASEILYYLDDLAFSRTLASLPALLAPNGRLVAVHWTGRAPDLARTAREAHDALLAAPGLRRLPNGPRQDGDQGYLLDTLTTA